jgi:hypothetical protein
LEDLVAMVAVEAGPLIGTSIRDLFPDGFVESALDVAAAEAASVAAGTRRRRKKAENAMESARSVLDERIGRPLRSALDGRARFGATLLEAALGVAAVEAELADALA